MLTPWCCLHLFVPTGCDRLKDMLAETLAVHDTAIGRDALPSHSAADLTISLLDQLVVGQEVCHYRLHRAC